MKTTPKGALFAKTLSSLTRAFLPALGGLLVWTPLTWGQRPSEADAAALIEKSRDRALAYARSLPDFVCTEVIRRYAETRPQTVRGLSRSGGPMQSPAANKWTPTDKLTVKLSYFQQKEDHSLVLVNDKPTSLKYEGLAGGTGAGEFGGTLQNIFERHAQTVFKWESWKNIRRHRAAVYSYNVEAEHSHYLVMNGVPGDTHEAVVKFHGTLDVDRETGEVLHLTYTADQIPKEVKVDRVSTTVDYDFADVAGRNYLLPTHSETQIYSPGLSVMNEMDFREYRKFSTDSTIEFGVGK
jgi:hypothetical protein